MSFTARVLFPAALGLALLTPALQALAQPSQPGPGAGHRQMMQMRTVAVSGHGEVEALPDMATLRLGVSERGPDLQRLRAQVAAAVERFLKLTDSLDIDREDVQTTAINVRPLYRYERDNGEQTLTGYEVSRQLTVKLEEVARLGELVEKSVALGVNQASAPELGVRDRARLHREALSLAAQDARARAEALVETLGGRVGKARRIDAANTGGGPPPILAAGARRLALEDAGETYSAGSLTVTADVTVVFDLVD